MQSMEKCCPFRYSDKNTRSTVSRSGALTYAFSFFDFLTITTPSTATAMTTAAGIAMRARDGLFSAGAPSAG